MKNSKRISRSTQASILFVVASLLLPWSALAAHPTHDTKAATHQGQAGENVEETTSTSPSSLLHLPSKPGIVSSYEHRHTYAAKHRPHNAEHSDKEPHEHTKHCTKLGNPHSCR